MLFLETFPPQQSCSSIFLDLVIQNSHFRLYSDSYSVLFPFLLSVYSMTLGKAVQRLSLVPSFTQCPSACDCFEWKKRMLHFSCKHVGFGSRCSFNLQLYNRRRFCSQGITECCTSEGTVLPAQIRSLDDHEILPVAIHVLLCFWLDFSML